jgi:hypothetical protein
MTKHHSLVACHAIHGDGTINWYRGPLSESGQRRVRELDAKLGPGMFDIDPDLASDNYCIEPASIEDEICDIGNETELLETLRWWGEGCPDDEERHLSLYYGQEDGEDRKAIIVAEDQNEADRLFDEHFDLTEALEKAEVGRVVWLLGRASVKGCIEIHE